MTQIAFIACSKTKADQRAPAAALYTSALFRKSLLIALGTAKKVYILSAKYGVLTLGEIIEPYNVTLKSMLRNERNVWRETTSAQLADLLKAGDVANFYCGEEYIAPLRREISQLGCRLCEPLAGLSFGRRLEFLRDLNDESALKVMLKKFYRIMQTLWAAQETGRKIADCSGKLSWPKRGVYFIIGSEHAPVGRMPRIIRVGTHAVSAGSRTSLWDRVSTHRGTSLGGGSHRSSIFRSHVGRVIMNRNPHEDWPVTWGQGQTAPTSIREDELALEQQVTGIIGEMRLLWLHVPDAAGPASDRAFLERNAIGLLSRTALLSPVSARSWLGNSSSDWRIAISGLWNLDHLFLRPNPAFLEVLETYVNITLGRKAEPAGSIAPKGWYSPLIAESAQLNLFTDQNDGHV